MAKEYKLNFLFINTPFYLNCSITKKNSKFYIYFLFNFSKERVLDVQDNMVLTAIRKEKYVTSLNLGILFHDSNPQHL